MHYEVFISSLVDLFAFLILCCCLIYFPHTPTFLPRIVICISSLVRIAWGWFQLLEMTWLPILFLTSKYEFVMFSGT